MVGAVGIETYNLHSSWNHFVGKTALLQIARFQAKWITSGLPVTMSGFAPRIVGLLARICSAYDACSNPLAFHRNLITMQRRPANAARQSTS